MIQAVRSDQFIVTLSKWMVKLWIYPNFLKLGD